MRSRLSFRCQQKARHRARWSRGPLCILLTLLLVAATASAASAAEPLRYHGGEVQHTPHIYQIYWGSSWTEAPNAAARAQNENFFKTVSGSSWMGILTQYFDESGAISSSVGYTSYLDSSVSSPTNVTYNSLTEEVAKAISVNGWPHGKDDQFMVLTPTGAKLGGESLMENCGWHADIQNEKVEAALQGVAFSFVGSSRCNVLLIASHEFAETVTDPRTTGQLTGWWKKSGPEVADGCPSYELSSGVFITQLSDNHLHGCVAADANPPRLYAISEEANGVTYKSANLNGLIDPAGRDTHYHFEYGTTTSYGSSAPTSEVDAGSGWKTLEVKATIQSLKPETTYHYRIVGNNSSGQNTGEDMTFVTPADQTPHNTSLPQFTPTTPNQSAPVTVSTGTWTGSPTSYRYQWEFCWATKEGCIEIGGATTSSYTPPASAVGGRLRVIVTAVNAYGETSVTSKLSEPVRPVGEIAEYALPHWIQNGIAAGPDGNFWFHDAGYIGKITPAGQITEYPLPANLSPQAMAPGPDGNVWFVTGHASEGKIGKITPLGAITTYSLPQYVYPSDIVAGPDGNMWFTTDTRRVGKITTSGTITEYAALPEGVRSFKIINGPDGKLWVSDWNEKGNLWKVTTAGVGTQVAIPDSTWTVDLATGPDGNVWFTVSAKIIGKVVPATGAVTEYPLSAMGVSFVNSLASGPDGNVWFSAPGKIGRIKPTGAVTLYEAPCSGSAAIGEITAGPDGRMWASFYEEEAEVEEVRKVCSRVAAIAP